ncbi:MAG: hypothetical protein IJO62_00095 [Clostridia bacterium]|nr:hypothetical protein [Clostridia bacterium]
MKYLFAEFKWEIDEKYGRISKEAMDYKASFDTADFNISVSETDIDCEASVSEQHFSKPYLEFIAVFRKMGEILPLHNAFVLHSACFSVDGIGVAFAAKSGTGKTTHLSRWQSYLGDKMTVVNGDKPIVRFIDGVPIAYGTPWCGKEKLGSNTKVPLKHICFIERSDANFVEKVSKETVVERILNQVYMPKTNPEALIKTMELADRLLSQTEVWIIHCNLDKNAGEIAYKSIFK